MQLALLLRYLTATAAPVQFIVPDQSEIDRYLLRMDFYSHVPPEVELVSLAPPKAIRRNDQRHALIELRRFCTWTEAEELLDRLPTFLRAQELPPPLVKVIFDIVSELCDNAATHSRSPCGAFLAAQSYTVGTPRRLIAVGDLGVGIRRHLANNPKYANLATDREAIAQAIKPGVSGTSERRGFGLHDVQEHAARVGQARLMIRSYRGVGRIRIGPSGRRTSFEDAAAPFPGTVIQMELFK